MSLLTVDDIYTAYGETRVHKGVSLAVEEGEIATILGSNGAGKTTLLHAICGSLKVSAGQILFKDRDITNWEADRVARAGITLVPEGRRIFVDQTVRDNLELGAYSRRDAKVAVERDLKRMLDYFPALAEKQNQRAGSLSGGQQAMLAIARGLMARPKILLLDEPSLGLSPLLISKLGGIIRDLREQFGATVLLVEQNAGLALAVAQRGYFMQTGEIVASGDLAALRATGAMKELYLGRG